MTTLPKEGAPHRYARQPATVLTEDGERHHALTYVVVPERQQAEFVAPSSEYVALVADGLLQHALPTSAHAQAAVGEQPQPRVRHLFAYGLLQSPYALGQSLDGIMQRQSARAPGRLFDLGESRITVCANSRYAAQAGLVLPLCHTLEWRWNPRRMLDACRLIATANHRRIPHGI
ncbi:hypothetical protein CKO36_17165 [Rhabdochromatium marinum]|nr:hypothetical protein [Rhabdochromatium marinum]